MGFSVAIRPIPLDKPVMLRAPLKLNQGGIVLRQGRDEADPSTAPARNVGDKAYDSQKIRYILRRQGTTPVKTKRKK